MKLAAVRTPNSPLRIGRTWYFPDGGRTLVVAGGADDGPLIIPEDLGEITDEDLDALEVQVVDEIDAMLDADSDDMASMTALAEGLEKIRVERGERTAEAEKRKADRDALRQRIHPVAEDDGDNPDDGDDPGDGDPSAADSPDGAAKELVAAAPRPAPVPARRPASASATSRRAARPTVPEAQPRVTITAAAEVPGLAGGTTLDLTQVAVALHAKARTLSDKSPRANVASFHLPIAAADTIGKMTSNEGAFDILDRVAAPSNLMSNGLVASGGWCTPSQNMYELLALDSATGLLNLPSVGIDRGGINVPSYIGIDAADGALWQWSEDQDVNSTVTITDLDVLAGVGTATSTGTNFLVVGDMIELQTTNPLANGPHHVASIIDATHFTISMPGVPDAANATGTGTRQKGCFRIPCPTWTDYRLGAYGMCLSHGNLTDRAFPELTRRYVGLLANAHMHRMSAINLAKIASTVNSDAVTIPEVKSDSYGELMSALELSTEDYRSQYKIGDNVPLEVLMPDWVDDLLRADLAMRPGVDLLSITDAQISAAFTTRNVRPQFLMDYQPLWAGSIRTTWPTSVQFIIYPAGGFVEGKGGTIDLGVVRDSRLNATNDFTAAWSEEFSLLARRGPKARKVTAPLTTDGVTGCCPLV